MGFQNRHSKEAPQNRCKSLESQINLAQAGRFPFKEISTGTIQGQVEHTIRGSSLCKGVGALAIGTRRHLPFVPDHKTIDLTRSYPVGSASEQIPRGRGAAGSPLRLVPGRAHDVLLFFAATRYYFLFGSEIKRRRATFFGRPAK